jgi:hypothetical protein
VKRRCLALAERGVRGDLGDIADAGGCWTEKVKTWRFGSSG